MSEEYTPKISFHVDSGGTEWVRVRIQAGFDLSFAKIEGRWETLFRSWRQTKKDTGIDEEKMQELINQAYLSKVMLEEEE